MTNKIFPALIFGLLLYLSGCSGGPIGGSSDEGAVAYKDNQVLGIYPLSIFPEDARIEVVPINPWCELSGTDLLVN